MPITAEVRTHDGRWYARDVLPYRSELDRIDGVCIAFHDVTDRKKAAQEIDEAPDRIRNATITVRRLCPDRTASRPRLRSLRANAKAVWSSVETGKAHDPYG